MAGKDFDRGSILKGVMVVQFTPSNDIYHSVLSGCGAIVVKMYGNDSIGYGTNGTLPQLMNCESLGTDKKNTPHSEAAPHSSTCVDSALYAASTVSQFVPPPSDSMCVDSQSIGGFVNSALSALHQRVRKHKKQIEGMVTGQNSLSCCIFLENMKDVNKEVINCFFII